MVGTFKKGRKKDLKFPCVCVKYAQGLPFAGHVKSLLSWTCWRKVPALKLHSQGEVSKYLVLLFSDCLVLFLNCILRFCCYSSFPFNKYKRLSPLWVINGWGILIQSKSFWLRSHSFLPVLGREKPLQLESLSLPQEAGISIGRGSYSVNWTESNPALGGGAPQPPPCSVTDDPAWNLPSRESATGSGERNIAVYGPPILGLELLEASWWWLRMGCHWSLCCTSLSWCMEGGGTPTTLKASPAYGPLPAGGPAEWRWWKSTY